ncbi:MAG: hypothetical protein ACYTEQ_27865 [Planctomycetota bacterium]|jgi:hypothetical protein
MDESQVKTIVDKALKVHVYEHHKGRQARRFVPPTEEELLAYAIEKRLPLNVEKFLEFYASKGWKVGQVAMKDWKAAARRAAKEWAKNPYVPWLQEKLPQKATDALQGPVISPAERKALREQIQGVGPVPKDVHAAPKGKCAQRQEIDRLFTRPKPAPTTGPTPFDPKNDPELQGDI